MEHELTELEQQLAALLTDYRRLKLTADTLRRDLARAEEENRMLSARITAASTRLDTLLEQMPVGED